MLAQNFKTPADLRIDPVLFEALHTILRMLEREEIAHTPVEQNLSRGGSTTDAKFFNMAHIAAKTDCGTACCFLGWARFLKDWDFSVNWNDPQLDNLFQPGNIDRDRWSEITPRQGAYALRSYLAHGDARWNEALAH